MISIPCLPHMKREGSGMALMIDYLLRNFLPFSITTPL